MKEQVNETIQQRTKYGVRTEVAEKRGYVLIWSNNSRSWYRDRHPTLKGTRIRLDANEILAYDTAKNIDGYIETLDELPLYAMSYEARYGL